MQTRVRSGSSSMMATSPSQGRRQSNAPTPLTPQALVAALPRSSVTQDGAASCPVRRPDRSTSEGSTSRESPFPVVSPSVSTPPLPRRSPLPAARQQQQQQHTTSPQRTTVGSSALNSSLPPPGTPTLQSGRRSRSSLSENSPCILSPQHHDLVPSMPSLAVHLPPVVPSMKLPSSATTAMTPVRQLDEALHQKSSPARRFHLEADSHAHGSNGSVPGASARIPTPSPPLTPAPAPARRPSSTSNIAAVGASSCSSIAASMQEGEGRISASGGGGGEAFLRENPRVRILVNNLYHNVITAMPDDPLKYLVEHTAGSTGVGTPVPPTPTPESGPAAPLSPPSSTRVCVNQEPLPLSLPRDAVVVVSQSSGDGTNDGEGLHAPTEELLATPHPPTFPIEAIQDSKVGKRSGEGLCSRASAPLLEEAGQQTERISEAVATKNRSPVVTPPPESNGYTRMYNGPSTPLDPTASRMDGSTSTRLTRALPSAPTMPPRSGGVSSAAAISSAPSQTVGGVTAPSISSHLNLSGSAVSKRGSPHLTTRSALGTNSLTSSGFLSAATVGYSVGGCTHQLGSGMALLLHGGSGPTGFRSGVAVPPPAPSMGGSIPGLERGEVTPSDISSVLSTNSVDIHEFIAEFRRAKEECIGGGADRQSITLDDLANILECSSIPCPEAGVLLTLFDELQPCAQYLAGQQPPTAVMLPRQQVSSLPPRPGVSHCNGSAGTGWAGQRGRDLVPSIAAMAGPALRGGVNGGSLNSVSSFSGACTADTLLRAIHAGGDGHGACTVGSAADGVTAALPPVSLATHGGRQSPSCDAEDASATRAMVARDGNTGAKETKTARLADSRRSSGRAVGDGGPSETHSDVRTGAASGQCTLDHDRSAPSPFDLPHLPTLWQSPLASHPTGAEEEGEERLEEEEEAPTVFFDTLVARMAYKIQGYYSNVSIRIAFYGMVVDESSMSSVTTEVLESGGVAHASDGAVGGPHPRGLHCVSSVDSLAASEAAGVGSGSAATAIVGYGTLPTCTVQLSRCILEGMYGRLGIVDVSPGELQRALRTAGLPTTPDEQRMFECRLEDFARLVRTVTAIVDRGANVTPSNLFLTSLRDSHLQRGGGSGSNNNASHRTASSSWKDDSSPLTNASNAAAAAAAAFRALH